MPDHAPWGLSRRRRGVPAPRIAQAIAVLAIVAPHAPGLTRQRDALGLREA